MALLSSPQQLLAYFPLTTRVFTGSTVALSILYYVLQWNSTAPNFAPYLTLIPGISIFYPWTLLTAGLVETTVIEVRRLICNTFCSLMAFLAGLYPYIRSDVIKLLGAPLGSCRNGKIYRRHNRDPKPDVLWS